VLAEQAAVTRADVERLNTQLARQREINEPRTFPAAPPVSVPGPPQERGPNNGPT
jgi:hypothetical protein